MGRYIVSLFFLFFGLSCSSVTKFEDAKTSYDYQEKGNSYNLERDDTFKNRTLYTRSILKDSSRTVLERSITKSSLGLLKKNVKIISPEQSIYEVWVEGTNYRSEIEIRNNHKSIEIKTFKNDTLLAQEEENLPEGENIFCFFSQLSQCAFITDFFEKVEKSKSGVMNFYLIWEGYPFIHDFLVDVPKKIISSAKIIYEGKGQYSLRTLNQTIYFNVNSKGYLEKMYWISQGLDIVKKL